MLTSPAKFLLVLVLPFYARSNADSNTALLDRMAQQSAAYRNSLPNFTCEEDVVTATRQSGKPLWRVNFHATLRVHRDPDGALREVYTMTRYLGEPIIEGSPTPPIPLYVQGGFGKGVPSFFAAGQQACYKYSFSSNRIGFAGLPGLSGKDGSCADVHSTTGFADLDAGGNITHGETRLSLKEADKLELTTFAAVDYAPVTLDNTAYRLPVHLYAEKQDGKYLYTFDAHYSNCKLFHTKVTISPAGSTPIDPNSN